MSSKYNLDKENEITDEIFFHNRRKIIASSVSLPFLLGSNLSFSSNKKLAFTKDLEYSTNEQTNTIKQISSYNNFYELGTGKRDPLLNADKLKTNNWKLSIDGLVENSLVLDSDDLVNKFPLEERIYRLRCVEAWSLVVPWIGFELSKLIKLAKPLSNAKYVAFESILDRENLPGQKRDILNWPYREGLRIDEALNPLAFISVGLYGKVLPNQNGSPVRLVVPWKYGFKSIKSLVKISFVEKQPICTWNEQTPNEYGFYSNVNPLVSHPRWSQKRERRIGEFTKRDTLMFNGYSKFVNSLYSGMDLKKNF
ncbi:MAG: protein-methionine-sulfoxide reductase catalytic subunit MsrP [Pelagibacterales bacterium]|nr:protein-methionine-sulfoxide reductase catalytic subunit MsrP [Pelagibacterales bacterium]|tara:strand:+ start:1032 stop:1961 length:930 start_codon:yes stop_codon:yes gene_type:complete